MSSHACPGCGVEGVDNSLFACKPCWYRLPKKLRGWISNAWNAKAWESHARAMRTAVRWYQDNPAEAQR